MKAEIKVIKHGNNIREGIRAGGKTVQLTLDTGERVYRWEQSFSCEELSYRSWDLVYEYAITQGKLVLGQKIIDDDFRDK